MNVKNLQFSESARQSLQRGVNKLADAVISTYGPMGRTVLIEKSWGSPISSKDGITVAREIKLEDRFENLGAEIVKEASSKTNDICGDGSTGVCLLTKSIFNEGLKLVVSGVNPITIRKGLEKKTKEVVENLKAISKSISNQTEVEQIASISSNDVEIGKIIAEAMESVGNNGMITIEENQGFGVSKKITNGIRLDKGYISSYFSNSETLKAEIDKPFIILTDKVISNVQEILPLLEKTITSGNKNLLIIAEDLNGEALSTLILNKLKGVLNVVCVKLPGFGDSKKETLKDLGILTNGQIISDDTGVKFSNIDLMFLGQAEKVIVSKDETIIIGGKGVKEEVDKRIAQVKKELEETEGKFDKTKLEERLAKLAGRVAVIKVGAATETEMKEKKDRIEDALNATRAAVEEGIVVGGGSALLLAGKLLEKNTVNQDDYGTIILNKALLEPIKTIANNAGQDGSLVLFEVMDRNKDSKEFIGYNAATDTYEELMNTGVVDPCKVVRVSLENAVSAALTLLSTEAIICDLPTEKKEGEM